MVIYKQLGACSAMIFMSFEAEEANIALEVCIKRKAERSMAFFGFCFEHANSGSCLEHGGGEKSINLASQDLMQLEHQKRKSVRED